MLADWDCRPAFAARKDRHSGRPPPLIVLDAGHGGRDLGATGVTGTYEKDVTLAMAWALKTVLEERGCYRVELTRPRDTFLPRPDRLGIAHDLGASLFMSLHADTLLDPSVRGASVYTLAKNASDAEAGALADRENGPGSADDPGARQFGPEVSEILASLAARETRAASSRIARQLVSDLRQDIQVLPSPERRGNFTVLHSAAIPSVLVEMGFLSNPEDEAALNDLGYRQVLARSMTRAVEAWFAGAKDRGTA